MGGCRAGGITQVASPSEVLIARTKYPAPAGCQLGTEGTSPWGLSFWPILRGLHHLPSNSVAYMGTQAQKGERLLHSKHPGCRLM